MLAEPALLRRRSVDPDRTLETQATQPSPLISPANQAPADGVCIWASAPGTQRALLGSWIAGALTGSLRTPITFCAHAHA